MSVKGLPPVSPSTAPMLASVAAWGVRLVAPLGSSAMSANGMMELADRVKYILSVVLFAIIVFATKYSHLLGRATVFGAAATNPAGKQVDKSSTPPGEPVGGSIDDSPTLTGVIGDDARQIDTAFDGLLLNLRELRGAAGKAFEEQVQQFHQIHDGLKDDPTYAKAFQHVELDEQYYRFLLEMKGAIFFTKNYIDDAGILQMPPDGNCLFHTLGRGLALLEPALIASGDWNDFPYDHITMREAINGWMVSNLSTDEQLCAHIDSAIIEYCPILDDQQTVYQLSIESEGGRITDDAAYLEKERQLQILKTVTVDSPGDQRAHEIYIQMTLEEGKFASSPQIYAFCKLNPAIGVRISRKIEIPARDGSGSRVITSHDFDLPFNPGARFFINPVYSLAGDHFDLLLPLSN